MKVINISFKDYLTAEDRDTYDYYLKYGKFEPIDILGIGNFFDCSFGFVKDMQYYASEGFAWQDFFETVVEETNVNIKELAEMSLFDLHQFRLYCIKEVEKINKIESEYLGGTPSAYELQADIERFNSYGSFMQFDKLSGGDIRIFEEIKKLKYNLCFTKLKLEADRANFMEDYQRIISKKK